MQNKIHLGQHWLKNRNILDQIASLASPEPLEAALPPNPAPTLCLEIGPGLGTLTASLFRHFNQILAIEFDPKLAKNLPYSFPGKNLIVKNCDFLEFDLNSINKPYVAVGNIPYYITSPIIHKLITAPNRPQKIILLIQKEVAERICSSKTKHNFLSILVQNYATPVLGPLVGRELFTPPPKVDSQVLILHPHAEILSQQELEFTKLCFTSPRKKLAHNLFANRFVSDKNNAKQILQQQGLNPNCRPADLDHQDWKSLANLLFKH